MKLNNECIRDVLAYLIENLTINIDETNAEFNKIGTREVMNKLCSKYSKEDIWYSVFTMFETNYITVETNMLNNNVLSRQLIVNVTYNGHQFYELTKPEDVWRKTQSIIKKVGGGTLEFVKEVAHDVAVASAKAAVTVSFGQQPTATP